MKNAFFLPDKILKYLFLLALLIGFLFSCKKTQKDCEDIRPDRVNDVAISFYLKDETTDEPILGFHTNQVDAYNVTLMDKTVSPRFYVKKYFKSNFL
ncbi:MAG: hypothetical protein RLZZ292_2442 [Bacteroidota bacterium]|jgi:hypothetical protein